MHLIGRKPKSGVWALMSMAVIMVMLLAPVLAADAQAETKTLKILSNNPFSGKAASWGFSQDRGVGLAIDKVNKAGGIKIKGVTYKWEKIRLPTTAIFRLTRFPASSGASPKAPSSCASWAALSPSP